MVQDGLAGANMPERYGHELERTGLTALTHRGRSLVNPRFSTVPVAYEEYATSSRPGGWTRIEMKNLSSSGMGTTTDT